MKRSTCASGREGPLLLDGILRRDDEERVRKLARLTADRDLFLAHRFQQGGLGLGRRAVDLVGQHHVREDRSLLELELAGLLVVDVGAGDVGRQQIGRELNPLELEVERRREGPRR